MSKDSPPDFTEKQLTTKLVYDGRLLKVREDTVLLPDGKTARREYVQHPGAVIVIALLDAKTVLMERQFRYPLGRHFYELPAGKIDPGEDALATAQRELIEECGYEARSWRHLATLHPCIGYSDERFELYLARELVHVGHVRDAGEFPTTPYIPPVMATERVPRPRRTKGCQGQYLRSTPFAPPPRHDWAAPGVLRTENRNAGRRRRGAVQRERSENGLIGPGVRPRPTPGYRSPP